MAKHKPEKPDVPPAPAVEPEPQPEPTVVPEVAPFVAAATATESTPPPEPAKPKRFTVCVPFGQPREVEAETTEAAWQAYCQTYGYDRPRKGEPIITEV
ncbi:MAG TPA: hypothetical protein VEA41_01095 [Salinarimonas sp.]|nr:hypothetical protein [Salinarimonas sp.]